MVVWRTNIQVFLLGSIILLASLLALFAISNVKKPQKNESDMISYFLTSDIELRWHNTTFPNNGKLTGIHKGTELVYRGLSLIGEGFGFGAPIVIANQTPFVSSSAKLRKLSQHHFAKDFIIDTVDRSSNFKASYERIPAIGVVSLHYFVESTSKRLTITYTADLRTHFESIYLLNEQNFDFGQYFDSDLRYTENLSTWNMTRADRACFTHSNGVRFCLISPDTTKFFGREWHRGYLDWAGISIQLNSSKKFQYELEITSLSHRHIFLPTEFPVISSPAPVFLDGTDWYFTVGDWGGWLYYLPWGLNYTAKAWKRNHDKGIFASPAVFYPNSEQGARIAISTENGSLVIYDTKGNLISTFSFPETERFWSSPVYTGKGLALLGERNLYYLALNGSNIPGWPQSINGWGDSTPAYFPNLHGNDQGLLAVASLTLGELSEGYLYVWWENGSLVSDFPVRLSADSDSSPVFADIDEDGLPEIVVGDDGGLVHAFALNGTEMPNFPVNTQSLVEASPSIAKASPNGPIIIAIGSWDHKMYVLNEEGKPYDGFPVAANDHIISSAALVDLNGDNRTEIIVGSKDQGLYAWDLEGNLVPFFPFNLSSHVFSSPLVIDLNSNGFLDVVVGANNGIHVILDVGVGRYWPWPMFHQNPQRTGTSIRLPFY
ncbi:MAG: FG-GAP repeat domain-containing protein [Candidatus Heimdallarchaeota archaeon]